MDFEPKTSLLTLLVWEKVPFDLELMVVIVGLLRGNIFIKV